MAQRLFLYGTLLTETGTPMARWLAPKLSCARRASVPGRLLAIATRQGWYPALIPGLPGERAWGTACEAALTRADWAKLDRYEGREYRRVRIRVGAGGGPGAMAWAYRWRASVPLAARYVHGGDVPAWLARTGRRPFGGADRS